MTTFGKLAVTGSALALLACLFAITRAHSQMAATPEGFKLATDDQGVIRVPSIDYRKDWVVLGTWAVAAAEGEMGAQGFHVVYSQPESVAAYRETGAFPDGAVLIKELFSVTTEDMTTGTVSRAAETQGWFVMIKDSVGRYPSNKLWGDGWGWAYFDAKDRHNTTSTDYQADCLGCHIPAKDQDWVYVQGYPVLHDE